MVNEPELKDAEFTGKRAPPHRLQTRLTPGGGWSQKQKTITFVNVVVMVVIALAILVVVNYITNRRYFRFDLTFKQEYSLSAKSKDIIKQIKEPIIIYTFFVQPNDQIIADTQRMMLDLLEEYKIYGQGKILIESVQPAANPEMVEILQKKFNLDTIAANDMILRSGNNQKNVNLGETFEREEGPYGRPSGMKAFRGEESLTSAIMNIIKSTKTIIYFVTGHEEGGMDDSNPEGYSLFVNYLQRENIECKKISLLETTQIPTDCSALIIPGPKKAISLGERNLVNNYLKDGGRLMIMIDPMIDPGLNDFLAEWGVKTDDGIIIDPDKSLVFLGRSNPAIIMVDDYANHPITEKMKGDQSILPITRAVESISPTLATEIAKTSANSWLETNTDMLAKGQFKYDKDADRKGPLGVAVAVSKPAGNPDNKDKAEPGKESRMVVFGDSDMVRNRLLDPNTLMGFGRPDIALNSIRWLAGQESFITIEPKKVESKRIDLTPGKLSFLFWFSLIIIPSVGALVGIAMWLIRRK